LLASQGASLDTYLVGVSLCCPSRASTLRGQYAHSTGVLVNEGPQGGFGAMQANGLEQATIATALQGSGYRTALVGKYLNGYPLAGSEKYIPPGWDVWYSPAGGWPYSEYDYTINDNGTLVPHGHAPRDYGTDVLIDKAIGFLRQAAPADQPFFLYLALYAPHEPAVAAPRHAKRFALAAAPRTPAYNEADVSDKPAHIARARPMPKRVEAAVDGLYRRRLRSLMAVDEGVERIVTGLTELGQLDRTYIVFTSDNGFHLGQHRLPAGKRSPYEEDIRVPMFIRGPGIAAGSHLTGIAANTDLAPTFADLGGAQLAYEADGRSLVPLLRGTATTWRSAYLVDQWTGHRRPVRPTPPPSDDLDPVTLEPPDLDEKARIGQPAPSERDERLAGLGRIPVMPEYHGVRTDRYLYVEYVTGEKELYDLQADPYELDNLSKSADPALLAELAARLAALKACSGHSCRSAEDGLAH
jgi:arylsulfatase A-like enzyme